MRLFAAATVRAFFVIIVIGLIVFGAATQVFCEETLPPVKSVETSLTTPSLADVVYQAGALTQRLSALKSRPDTSGNLQKLEQRLKQAQAEAERFHSRLSFLKDEDLQSYQQLAALKGEVRSEADAVKRVVESLSEAIREMESRRRNWLVEKSRWEQWRSQLGADLALKSVADAFVRANTDIDDALDILSRKLEPLLAVQQKAGDIGAKISGLADQIDTRIAQQRGGTLRGGMPNMFSIAYLQQLIDLASEPSRLIKTVPPPDPFFLSEKGWVIVIQVVVFVFMFTVIRRYRSRLLDNPDRRFLGKRPVSLSLFVTIFTFSFLYGSPPTLWRVLIQTIAGVVTARLVAAFVKERWIKRAIYILILVMVGFQALLIAGVPPALMRLFLLVWSLTGIVYFGWRGRQGAVAGHPAVRVWLLRLVVGVFIIIAVADVIGFGNFAVQIMDGTIRTSILLLMGWAMLRLIRVALELGVESLPVNKFAFLRQNADAILRRVIFFANSVIVIFVAANLLVAWKLYDIPVEALQAFFSFGTTIGEQKITLGLVVAAILILYGAFALSWGLQALLMENVLSRRQMDTGARLSIVRLVHYALVLVGFLVALSALGFELKNITIIGGALGVGIGFGMQAIVNNFVSGLILLFERPIKVGDVIQLSGGQQGRVTNLGLRATTIQTFDRAEIVVPNGDLISAQVTNWTLGDRSMRLIIPVGVAYGSDVETVMRILMAVATESDQVLKDPQPMVLFLNFGDSSLDFQLRVWIADFNDRRIIQSALIRDIDRRFRAEGVEIPFPQRDLHLRSVDGKAADRLKDHPNASAAHLSDGMAPVPEST
ncbi:mechanosensitive ion channel domain-containing protein [uncultured Desulfosarcina sp.]|uniref:mechanosensitive ion channel family protein n=1 Tax=uncultured Desulfosarcina sp. TaxID=218289 RepID=UPI0029C8562C|nr:mechanosensitive ion channel domain-containing protein [uncultured Desulfosarcina sp.]